MGGGRWEGGEGEGAREVLMRGLLPLAASGDAGECKNSRCRRRLEGCWDTKGVVTGKHGLRALCVLYVFLALDVHRSLVLSVTCSVRYIS